MNTTANNTKMQPETVNTKKLSRGEIRRRQKAADKEERAKAKKKAASKIVRTQCEEVLLQKAEEIQKSLKAYTWRDLEARGKFSKNDKLTFISDDMLIVGCDIGSETHYVRGIDTRGRELSKKAFSFSNSEEGFQRAREWAVGLAAWMVSNGISVVQVNPYAVKQTKELEDNSQHKDDAKDPKLIANLVKDGNYGMPYLPEGIYAELRRLSMFRDQLTEDRTRNINRLHREMKIYFPEYQEAFGKVDGTFALELLKKAPFPQDILALGETGVRNIWREAGLRGRGYSRAAGIVKAARGSVGLKEGTGAGKEAAEWFARKVSELDMQISVVENMLHEKCREIPQAGNILEISGVGENTLSGIMAEMGDASRFDDVKEIQKLSGLGLVACSSGKHKGETRISHRGRRRLRYWLFQAAKSAVAHAEEFKKLHVYYTTRRENPLKKLQSLIVIACKIVRIIYTMLKTGVRYDSDKMLRDIKHAAPVQAAAEI